MRKSNFLGMKLLLVFVILGEAFALNAQSWQRYMYTNRQAIFLAWQYDRNDRYFTGDFTGNGNDDMLLIRPVNVS